MLHSFTSNLVKNIKISDFDIFTGFNLSESGIFLFFINNPLINYFVRQFFQGKLMEK